MPSSTPTTVYLISGANRGIGFAITGIISKRDNHVVYAGVRNPDAADALIKLSKERPGAIKIVKLTSGSSNDAEAVSEQINQEYGYVNVVIANAGITIHEAEAKTKDVETKYIEEHFKVNTLGPIVLYQGVYPILKKAPRGAKFVTLSSRLGSMYSTKDYSQGTSAYGISKAAINFFLVKTHTETEEEGFVVFPVCPNWVSRSRCTRGRRTY